MRIPPIVAVAGLCLTIPSLLLAQQNCAPRQIVLEKLTSDYGETRQSIGITADGKVVETFASAETQTWTIVVTLPDGISCLAASGRSFEVLSEALPASGTAS